VSINAERVWYEKATGVVRENLMWST